MQNTSHKPVILVVDDDPLGPQLIAYQLARLGYATTVAAHGAQALGLWRDGGYAMLLTELDMPVMDGYRLAERIRHEEAGRCRLPIIALTAKLRDADAERSRLVGIDECFVKPMQLDTLAGMLARRLTTPAPASFPEAIAVPTVVLPATNASVLDLRVLHDLVGGATPLAETLLTVCEESLGGLLGDFDEAFASADVKRVAWLAHQLKSTARAIGAARLSDMCAELTGLGSRPGAMPLPQMAAAFRSALTDVQRAIASARPRPFSPVQPV